MFSLGFNFYSMSMALHFLAMQLDHSFLKVKKNDDIYIYCMQHCESIFVYSLNHQFIVLITLFMHIGYVVYVVIIIILAFSKFYLLNINFSTLTNQGKGKYLRAIHKVK